MHHRVKRHSAIALMHKIEHLGIAHSTRHLVGSPTCDDFQGAIGRQCRQYRLYSRNRDERCNNRQGLRFSHKFKNALAAPLRVEATLDQPSLSPSWVSSSSSN